MSWWLTRPLSPAGLHFSFCIIACLSGLTVKFELAIISICPVLSEVNLRADVPIHLRQLLCAVTLGCRLRGPTTTQVLRETRLHEPADSSLHCFVQDVLCDLTDTVHVAQNAVEMFAELHANFCRKH